jgi:hypothetical protein
VVRVAFPLIRGDNLKERYMGEQTIGAYLIDRLGAHDVQHVFGVPGDYVLRFFRLRSSAAPSI